MDPMTAMILATLGPQLFSMILGGGGNDNTTTQETVTETPRTGYQSPTLGLMDPMVGKMLMQNLSRMGRAGFPSGSGNPFAGGISQQIMDLLGGEASGLAKRYSLPQGKIKRA